MLSYLAIFLLGVFSGIFLIGVAIWYMLSFFFHDPESKLHIKPQIVNSSTFQLPPVLLSKINDESCKSKESCWALNFILYFLFRELRNSEHIRRWIIRKLSLEFDELLTSSVLGKVFSNISIHNLDVGHNFPVVNWLKTSKVELHPIFKSISTLDILVDIEYAGGFQFAISCATHLKHSAFLSVQINGVKGQARLQFQTDPYAHWSFSFVDNADIDISVVSQMGGKSLGQVTSIIASQLKRSVRKKHTLPMFKIRYKPFFTRIEHIIASLVPDSAPRADAKGILTVTLVECRGLMSSWNKQEHEYGHGTVYGHLAVGDFNWVAAYPESNMVYLILDVVCVKTAKREVNLDFTLSIQNDVPVVESVHPSPGRNARNLRSIELEPGDEIISVDGKRVSSIKQCIKCFRSSSSTKVIWRIRRRCDISDISDIRNSNEASSSLDVKKSAKLEDEAVSDSPSHSRKSSDETNEFDNLNADSTHKNFTFQWHNSSATDAKTHNVFRTSDFPATKDPIFMESFTAHVDNSNRYVNITLWSSSGAKTQNNSNGSSATNSPARKNKKAESEELFPFGKDRIVGVLNIPVFDVIAESATTGQGYFVKDYYLASPDGTSSAAREHSLKLHSGFEPAMCYGKLTVSFMWNKTGQEEVSKRKDSLDSISSNSASAAIDTALEATSDPTKLSPSDEAQFEHKFVRTHFRSATICDYCNKKIWLKEAFICQVCSMKCHKKCYERCMANTVCATTRSLPHPNIEIITTESEPNYSNDQYIDNEEELQDRNSAANDNLAANANNTVRRRTLGGLIVSAVQSRSAQLRRAGSATALSGSLNPNSASRSLPPSPQVSPTTSRKASVYSSNPFEALDAGGLDISDADLNSVVDHLIQHPNDGDLVSMAKETDRDVFKDVPYHQRKLKLNQLLNRLQEEIDAISNERIAALKEETAGSSSLNQAAKCEEKMQALALLMLHYFGHLQNVEEQESEMDGCQ